MSGSKLLGKIDFDQERLNKELDIINSFPALDEEDSQFGVGTWKNHTLADHNGDHIELTTLGEKLNYINEVINDNFELENLKMLGIRNLIDGLVIPHKNFLEVRPDKYYHIQIVIPLENNHEAYHSDEYGVLQMRQGEIWLLDANIVHASINFSNNSRVFLRLDFEFPHPASIDSLFKKKSITDKKIIPRIPERKINLQINDILEEQMPVLSINNIKQPFFYLSKLHYFYNVSIQDCYEWLIKMANMKNDFYLIDKCEKLKNYMIIHRKPGEKFYFR